MDDVDRSGFGAANQGGRSLEDGPPIDRIETVFAVYEARQEDGQIVYYGDPLTHPERVVRELWPIFRERGYDADLERRHGEYAIVAEPTSVGIDGIPWTNIVLFLLTVGSTLFAGSFWYQLDPIADPGVIWQAWPFTAAILGFSASTKWATTS